MLRIGIVDFDTSHVVQFTKRLNKIDVPEEQFVEGGKIVCGFRGSSEITEASRMDEYTEQVTGMGVPLVDNMEDMIGQVDAVCIESQAGSVHLDRVRPFLEAGIPAFIDKPFADTVENAKAMAELAEKNGVPLLSSSSLRFADEVAELKANQEEVGAILGANASSPAGLHEGNPGLLHYGIHGVETLYALMGPGCQYVQTMFTEGAEVSMGMWEGDRIGVVRGTRAGSHSYSFAAWGEKKAVQSPISTANIYRNLLREIIKTFETGTPSVPMSETIEIIAFINAALESAHSGGAKVELKN